jgi:[2Fe-2S] binding domain
LSQGGKLHPLQEAFWEQQGLQCGYCTPAMMLRALEILRETPNPTRDAVREGLASQLCRCTGYQFIVDAVMDAAQRMQHGHAGAPSGEAMARAREASEVPRPQGGAEAEGLGEQPAAAGPPRGGHVSSGETPAEHATTLGQLPGQPRGATEHGPDLDAVATHVATVMPQENEIHRMEREGRDLGTITAHPPVDEERTS